MNLRVWSTATPIGTWTVVVDDDDVVVVSGFEGEEETVGRLPVDSEVPRASTDIGAVSDAMRAYLEGDPEALDAVRVRQPGGAFRQSVWQVMREVPAGQTWSYTELATKAGNADAARAAASACATNMVAPFVPCHRIVRSDGSLGGYYYGLDAKRWLLAHEQAIEAQTTLL